MATWTGQSCWRCSVPDVIPVPPEAAKAAHDATTLPFAQAIKTSPYELIDIGLAAAAPHIAKAERERILALLDAWRCSCGADDCAAYDTRDQIAALIDSGARQTEGDSSNAS